MERGNLGGGERDFGGVAVMSRLVVAALSALVLLSLGAYGARDTNQSSGSVQGTAANLNAQIQGNVASGVADAGNPIKEGGSALAGTSVPGAVATGQRVNAWFDLNGSLHVRGGFRTTYTANYRLTARPYALSNAFGAAGIKQFATIYHAATATKTVRVRMVVLYVQSNSAAATYLFEVRRLSATTAPATGNPAITPIAHNSASAAAEATCLALPTTAGSESGANQGWGTQEIPMGITGSAGVLNPPGLQVPIVLWNDTGLTEEESLIMRSGVAEGFAVMVDASAAATLKGTIVVTFTEE